MKVSFEGIGEQVISFAADGTVKGAFVKMSDNGEVTACDAEDNFMGFCIDEDGGFASVLTHGFVKCPYTGDDAPEVGYGTLTADAGGKVSVSEDGREYLILEVDTTAETVGFIM